MIKIYPSNYFRGFFMKNNKSIKTSVWKIAAGFSLLALIISLITTSLLVFRTRHIEMACQIIAMDMENRLIHYNCIEKEK
jgi:hypothetical protein